MTEGAASDRFKPYLFVLQREGLTHAQFSVKFNKGTITDYLFKNNLIQECIEWLEKNYPDEGFYNKVTRSTHLGAIATDPGSFGLTVSPTFQLSYIPKLAFLFIVQFTLSPDNL